MGTHNAAPAPVPWAGHQCGVLGSVRPHCVPRAPLSGPSPRAPLAPERFEAGVRRGLAGALPGRLGGEGGVVTAFK